jgi:hypothetical protein
MFTTAWLPFPFPTSVSSHFCAPEPIRLLREHGDPNSVRHPPEEICSPVYLLRQGGSSSGVDRRNRTDAPKLVACWTDGSTAGPEWQPTDVAKISAWLGYMRLQSRGIDRGFCSGRLSDQRNDAPTEERANVR